MQSILFSWSAQNQNRFSLMIQPVWPIFFNFFARWPSKFCCAWHWLQVMAYSSSRKTLFTYCIFVFLLTSGVSFRRPSCSFTQSGVKRCNFPLVGKNVFCLITVRNILRTFFAGGLTKSSQELFLWVTE